MEMVRQDHHRIQTKWTPFRDVPERPAQGINLIDQQSVTPPLGEIDREKPRCAWNMSTAIFGHEMRFTFERFLTRTMRVVAGLGEATPATTEKIDFALVAQPMSNVRAHDHTADGIIGHRRTISGVRGAVGVRSRHGSWVWRKECAYTIREPLNKYQKWLYSVYTNRLQTETRPLSPFFIAHGAMFAPFGVL